VPFARHNNANVRAAGALTTVFAMLIFVIALYMLARSLALI
jgi:hypothetical protein